MPAASSQRWAVEWGGTRQLAQAGVKRDSLKIGDKVVISGRPSRVPGEYRVLDGQPDAPVGRLHLGPRTPTKLSTDVTIERSRHESNSRSHRLLRVRLRGAHSTRSAAVAAAAAAGPPLSPRQAAPIDLTGYWVSPIIEDWKYRMVTPEQGRVRRGAAEPRRAEARRELGSGEG